MPPKLHPKLTRIPPLSLIDRSRPRGACVGREGARPLDSRPWDLASVSRNLASVAHPFALFAKGWETANSNRPPLAGNNKLGAPTFRALCERAGSDEA